MEKSIFCEELETADKVLAAQEEDEKQGKSKGELMEAIDYWVKTHNDWKLFRHIKRQKKENRALRKENKCLKKENKCLKKENKRLTEEIEVLRGQTLRGMRGRGKTPAVVNSCERVDVATVDSFRQTVADDNVVCLTGGQKETFGSKIGETFLKALPKLLDVAVKAVVAVLIGRFPVWFGNRAGGLCT
ncbi:MAG: hypothetical protein K2N34_01510 [Lachnospiraceae bacterium]|nr:hypothetical protein [Lachnospiraceae bacterium]